MKRVEKGVEGMRVRNGVWREVEWCVTGLELGVEWCVKRIDLLRAACAWSVVRWTVDRTLAVLLLGFDGTGVPAVALRLLGIVL